MVKELIKNASAKNVSIICKIIDDVEAAYGRDRNSINSSYQFVEEANLNVLEKELLDKIKELAETENFFDYKEVESIYRIWKYLDKESLDLSGCSDSGFL